MRWMRSLTAAMLGFCLFVSSCGGNASLKPAPKDTPVEFQSPVGTSSAEFGVADATRTPQPMPPCSDMPRLVKDGPIDSFCVLGDVRQGGKVTLAELEAMPASTIQVTQGATPTPATHTYIGVRLVDLLSRVGLSHPNEQAKLDTSVSVSASNEHWITFSLAELDPQLGSTSAFVAYKKDGHLLGDSGMAELIVPTDKQTNRWCANIASVYVYSYSRSIGYLANPTPQPQPPTSLQVVGLGPNQITETLAKLEAMPATTITASGSSALGQVTHTYTGVPLISLLHLQPRAEGEQAGMSVSVLPNNGDWVTFSLAELSSELGKTTALLAYKEDGRLLSGHGFAELVVPSDKQASRWVENVVEVYVYYPFPPGHG